MSLDGLNTLMRMLQRKVRMCEITDNEKVFEDHLTHVLHEYFWYKNALFDVGTTFAHNRPETTTC